MSSHGSSSQLYRRLLSHVHPYRWVFIGAVVAMALTAAAETGFAAMLKPIMDNGFVDPDQDFIKLIPLLLLALMCGRGIFGFLASYTMAWIGRRVIFDLRQKMFERLLILPSTFYDDHSSATLVSKLIYDVEQAATATTDALTMLIKDSLTALGLLAWMIYLDWKLTVVFLLLAPLVAYGVRVAARRLRKVSERIQDSVGGIAHVAKEAIVGQRVIKTFGGHEQERRTFEAANHRNRQQAMKKATVAAAMAPIVLCLLGVGIAVVIYIAINRDPTEAVSAGTFVSYLGAVSLLMSPLKRLAKVNESVQVGIAAANSMFGLIDQSAEFDEGTVELSQPQGRVEYREVSFLYPRGSKGVLEQVSFVIEPGQNVALVGASGSGKSTTAALLLGFYRPTAGNIEIDGIDLRQISLRSLRANIALVTQETILFDDTIRNNICYGRDELDEGRLAHAIDAAHVTEFVSSLEQGLDSLVGEQGVRLSGGQRQRIAIARALYKNAPILVLDEATSSLDTVSERLVQQAMEALMAECTTLIIAHRLSTIRNADQIVVLDKGHVVETGNHEQLLALGGAYHRLYRTQSAKNAKQERQVDRDGDGESDVVA